MRTLRFIVFLLLLSSFVYAQSVLDKLTVEKIMRNPKWIGTSPTFPFWSPDSKTIYFQWNPENAASDSLYGMFVNGQTPRKILKPERKQMTGRVIRYNKAFTKATYEKDGDIYVYDLMSKKISQITNTSDNEYDPAFSIDDKKIIFSSRQNLFSWEMSSGKFTQLTDFRSGSKSSSSSPSEQEKWLKRDQLEYFQVLRERAEKQDQRKKILKGESPRRPKEIYLDDKTLELLKISPNEKYVTYRLSSKSPAKSTIVPNYVTITGFTEEISARTKVGASANARDFYLYDVVQDTSYLVKIDEIPGINDTLTYFKDYPSSKKKASKKREADVTSVAWSDDGSKCILSIASLDFKDRWIMLFDPSTRKLTMLYREHDEAWVNSPLSDFFGNDNVGWMANNKDIWFTSEETGYSHLYVLDVNTKAKKQLTSGQYEVQKVVLSKNKQLFYIIANESNPGEKQVYRLSAEGGKLERITMMSGAHELTLSPDEKTLALRYAYSNKPWELYLMDNKPGAKPRKVTNSLTSEFQSYPWRDPEIITFRARDSAKVYARIYKPQNPNGAGVIFVHGAGYLQNAHKWWSSYFREYMFHNLLADLGYTVLDIDYRASAGYGRDWRTGIYRHMGGKDLTDNLDGAKLLAEKYNVDPKRLGIYGGSYGGFITLMAMFTTPDVFAAGAALRPVTDWAHYNHPYTGAILNTPYQDSLSYAKSSPLYYADGLKGALLICHGMVDTNVHFQDAVLLAQRLIELGKDNWELAGYPMEDHAFVEASSWTDEYKRILKLFEQNLKPK